MRLIDADKLDLEHTYRPIDMKRKEVSAWLIALNTVMAKIKKAPTVDAEPCAFCRFYPPSGRDGNPCVMCPAMKRDG